MLSVAADCFSTGEAIETRPALDHPGRMSIREREIRWGRGWRGLIRRAGRGSEFTQHGIHHSGGETMPSLFGELDAFVDGGVRGNALKEAELKCAETESDENFRIETGVRFPEQRPEVVIEADLPAESAEHEGCGQVAIGGGELIDGISSQQFVGMAFAALDGGENVEGGAARR